MEAKVEKDLLLRIEELENRLAESEQLIEAIKAGEVDAFALNKNNQPEIFTLQSGDFPYRVLVENFGECAITLSDDGLIVYTNSYFHNLLKLPYERVIANSIFEFIAQDSRETFQKLFQAGLSGKSKGELNLFDGTTKIPVYVAMTSLQPLLSSVGVIITDLTEKKRRERELEEKNRFIETIIESSKELIAVYATDFTLLSINKATETFLDLNRSVLIGKKFQEIFPWLAGTRAEKDLERVFKGEFVKNEAYRSEYNQRYIQNYITPLRNESGEVYAALAIGHDVTDIKRAEEDLKKSQQRFVKLFSVSPVAMSLSHASDGKVIDVNNAWARMFELDPVDVIGKNAKETNIRSISEQNTMVSQINQSGGSVQGRESNFVLPSGKVLHTFVSVESIDLDGELCLLTAYFDLKERIRTEDIIKEANRQLEEKNVQLEQTNTELASFSFVASHDLQEPLRKIQTFSNRILDLGENEFSPDIKDYFNRILSATRRMKNLISDLLNYSRMNTAEMKFELMDLNVLAKEAKNNLEERIAETNAQVEIGQLPTAEIIPHQFTQLFNNLLSNALKYRKPDETPKIAISSEIVDGRLLRYLAADQSLNYHKISITDNGIGFEPIHAVRIFEMFQRLHGVNQYEGTGIGLAICKKIMQNHKGFIEAQGIPGVGAVFTLYLPAHVHETQNHFADRR
jgi:PAS domain S-box-containing protein